ncbi:MULTISPECIES: pyridoxamine 5'-phosphate oxidase family protein [Streptomyces]|uniref:pyridoxamine 5'-phosphate oxidase family protein n=1 Tax=Streptomyces TaxID=1883 RepID=UPI001F3D79B9|nr:pyridoxamine 5'-phosphate oxidase family protein [Streptomyces olivochromogenes]MCF3132342.1 pyridoxamine 5'-phosphate oxidase family protein [Streptomyces olivochromogenes]
MPLNDTRPVPVEPRRTTELDSAEALRLLGSVPLGRVVFTRDALPTIRPVNHVLADGHIVIRTHEGAALTSHTRHNGSSGVVVAYEADAIDPDTHLGWSVVVTGFAELVTDEQELERYRTLLRPWVRQTMEYAVRIRPDLVSGILVTEADRAADA